MVSIYEKKANQLAKAIDLALQVISESSTIPANLKEQLLSFSSNTRSMALNPEPQFRKVASLKYLENDFLIYWNETAGTDSDKFWKMISSAGLEYKRKDTIQDVLRSNKIKNIQNTIALLTTLSFAEQTGSITNKQVIQLNKLLAEFEARIQSSNK
jgi:hypothetical protein